MTTDPMPKPLPWNYVLPAPPPAIGYRNVELTSILIRAAEQEDFEYFQK